MANTPTSYTAESFPLAKGMQGENIKVLQTALGVEADGKFWNATETALKNLYNVTTCSEELFKQITGQKTKKKGFMANLNLSEKAKRGIKIGAICLGVIGGGILVYSLIDGNKKKSVSSSSASGKTAAAALNGTKKSKKTKKSSKKSKKSGNKLLALQ